MILLLLYLISLQNYSKKINELKTLYYDSACFPSPMIYESSSPYIEETRSQIAKRLSFKEAFQIRDKILFTNEFGSKSQDLMMEIMGSSPPKKDMNVEILRGNKRIVDLDLTRQDWGEYRNYKFGMENRKSFLNETQQKHEQEVLNEKKLSFQENNQNFGNTNMFLQYPKLGFSKENSNKIFRRETESSFCIEDKENYNINNYSRKSFEDNIFMRYK